MRPTSRSNGAVTLTLLMTCLTVLVLATLVTADDLEVDPDFRSVTLQWGGAEGVEERVPRQVVVTYCELQSWGPHRCRDKSVTASREDRVFTARLSGLRMATRYSFKVRASSELGETRGVNVGQQDGPALPESSVTAQTKGFSARATLCLANSTEVEVDTGPFFGGRISVEGMNGPPGDIGPNPGSDSEDHYRQNTINHKWSACSVWGDPQSPRATYRLRFDHTSCGGTKALNSSAVATFILVQESLPILTHSTRRFLVLCTAQPDTLTVSAGISLPGTAGDADNSVGGTGSAEAHRGARLLRNPAVAPSLETGQLGARVQLPHQARLAGSSGAQLVLMLALVSTVAVGSGFAAFWAVRRHRQIEASNDHTRKHVDSCSTNAVTLSRSSSFNDDDDFSITTYDNFASARNNSESEASSVLRGDVTSCSSLGDDDSSVPDQLDAIRVLEPAEVPSQPIYTTTIHIHAADEATQSEA